MDASLEILAGTAVRVAVLLGIAALTTATMHRRSAAARHMVWALAFAGALVLPALSVVAPVWDVAVLPATVPAAFSSTAPSPMRGQSRTPDRPELVPRSPRVAHPERDDAGAAGHKATRLEEGAEGPTLGIPMKPHAAEYTSRTLSRLQRSSTSPSHAAWVQWPAHWSRTVLVVWLVGTLLIAAHAASGRVTARELLRHAAIARDERWTRAFIRVMAQLQLRRDVVLLESARATTPAAWGILHPVVIVPAASADGWDDVQRQAVLLHELAHVERWDCLTQLVADLVCAVYWFNPLAWWAKHRLNTERERACDDRALAQGARASSYAEQLMVVAYAYRGQQLHPAGTLPMARPSQLEDRVCRVLDHTLRRDGGTRSTTLRFGAIGACVVLSVAAVHPHVAAGVQPAGRPLVRSTNPSAAPSPAPQPEQRIARPLPADTAPPAADFHWAGVLAAGDTIAIVNLTGAIRAEPATGSQVEVVAERRSERGEANTVQIRVERRGHSTRLCSVYPHQQSSSCDSYDFRNNNSHTGNRDCDAGRQHCGNDVRVDWLVRVPTGIRLLASTVTGDVTATGLQNDVSAKSVGGRVDVSTAGHASAWSMSRVNVVMGRTDWSGDLQLYGGGGLTVTLPANADAMIDATARFGKVRSDFPLQQDRNGSFGAHGTGVLGRGGRTLRIETLGGSLEIRSAAVNHVAEMDDRVRTPRISDRGTGGLDANGDVVDDSLVGSRSFGSFDRARIAAIVRQSVARADIAGAVAASLRAADIPAAVDRAMRTARIRETVDSAMRAAPISQAVDSAMRAAFGDRYSARSRGPQL